MENQRARTISALLTLTLLVAACSTSETTGSSTTAPTPTTASATATTEPPTTTTIPAPTGDGTALDAPLPVGVVASFDEWNLRIASVDADAYEKLAELDDFVEDPESGDVFVLVSYEATYLGDEAGTVESDFTLEAIGTKGTYNEFDDFCGYYTNNFGTALGGGTLQQDVCFAVPESDAANLTLIVDSWTEDTTVYFDLDPDATPADTSTSEGVTVFEPTTSAAVGDAIELGDWVISITGIQVGGAELGDDETVFVDEVPDGYSVVIATVEATKRTTLGSALSSDVSLSGFTADNVSLDSSRYDCYTDDEFAFESLVFQGGTVVHVRCWVAPTNSIDGMVLSITEGFFGEAPVFVSPEASSSPVATNEGIDIVSPVSNAVEVGGTGQVGGWEVQITASSYTTAETNTDFFVQIGEGQVAWTLMLELTNTSTETASVWDFDSGLLPAPNVAYAYGGNECSDFDESLFSQPEVEPGETARGTVCWVVEEADLPGATFFAKPFFYSEPDEIVWFQIPVPEPA